ncbi:hypothetical protein GDO78_017636 [Eleutherodactylus coqui]|uniref:Taste receptor type 2 n=1 Tax=Eleutherodactylus coqui TaxID=57060 RepID=A0A8J6EK92_ELECQ|nr:hypothetical protein GDO78_017636 [Eleutherodactylus coqui]
MEYVLPAVLHVSCLLGLTANLIIVAANIMKWKRLKSLPICDKILNSLAISRGLYFFSNIIWTSIFQIFPWLVQNNVVSSTVNILNMFMLNSSNWIATILCVFYCVKIITYNNKFFIFLKTRISTMLPWLFQASLLISLISSLPFNLHGFGLSGRVEFNGSIDNMTDYRVVTSQILLSRFLLYAVTYYPPFIIFCVANFLLIHFLLMHTRRMRYNGSHIQSPNLESHFSALKTMTLFLLLQIMILICMCISISGKFLFSDLQILVPIVECCPPLFHSLYMVASSSELRKMLTCLGLLRCS